MTIVLTAEVKRMFLDRDRVMRRVSYARRRALNRVGGAIRLTAKRSIRKRKRVSRPGEAPSSHSGELRGGIFYSYDTNRETVVIGPVRFSNSNVPEVLEHGGRVQMKKARGRGAPVRTKSTRIEARPYMGPAEQVNRERIPDEFAAAMRRI